MAEPLRVIAHAGYRGDEEPRELFVEGRRIAVLRIERAWSEPAGRFFRVEAADGRLYELCCEVADARWRLVSASPLRADLLH
ncbi:MAG: hypothetical protein HY744_04360 [Deltaproteobacteria bacterium]|nr:hypothetical protein [Deltaproteobacteria bacterium]